MALHRNLLAHLLAQELPGHLARPWPSGNDHRVRLDLALAALRQRDGHGLRRASVGVGGQLECVRAPKNKLSPWAGEELVRKVAREEARMNLGRGLVRAEGALAVDGPFREPRDRRLALGGARRVKLDRLVELA